MATTTTHKILVFGATGRVGGFVAARGIKDYNAEIHLAVRDTAKPFRLLELDSFFSDSKHKHLKHKADLTDPESIRKAVEASGATSVFLNLAGLTGADEDLTRRVVDALKAGGITYVVLLSSLSLGTEEAVKLEHPDAIQKPQLDAERAIIAAGFTSGYTFVRPGHFDSNAVEFWGTQIKSGVVHMPYPEAPLAPVSENDIGDVSYALLASKGAVITDVTKRRVVPLVGPELLTQEQQLQIVAKVLGRKIELKPLTEEQFLDTAGSCMPPGMADAVVGYWKEAIQKPDDTRHAENVAGYAGRPATTFEQWMRTNKAEFD
ncbi:hypothetical protein DFJ77DRAFT_328049 [Powellomyces hirtus]|nr:hypothetical protein DFJ77DRAFT_328049 [Powellomyces hirtus]